MNTFYSWQNASFSERLSVYESYVYLAVIRGDYTVLAFEEFNDLYYNHSYYYVAHKFGVV